MRGIGGRVKSVNKEAGDYITATAKQKVSDSRQDPRILALLFIEFIVVMMLAIGIYVYLDPEIEIIKVPFPFNLIGFAVLIAVAAYLFHLTQWFRDYRKLDASQREA